MDRRKVGTIRGKDIVLYRRGLFMTFSVRIILQALIDLDAANTPRTYEEIAAYARCSTKTVQRGVKRLESQKKVRRLVVPGGYHYEIKAES